MATTTTITVNDLRTLIRAQIQPLEPQTSILAFFRANHGKKLNKREEDKLRLIDPTIRVYLAHGMMNLYWGNYEKTSGREGGSLLLAYQKSGTICVMDATFLEERNAGFFKVLEEQNKKSLAFLEKSADPQFPEYEQLRNLVQAINNYNAAVSCINDLTSYQEPIDMIRLEVRKLMVQEL